MKKVGYLIFFISITSITHYSCTNKGKIARYNIEMMNDSTGIEINSWNILGPSLPGNPDSISAYLSCTIYSKSDREVFLFLDSPTDLKVWINAATVPHLNIKEYYKLPLKKGKNTLMVKIMDTPDESYIEGRLSMKQEYLDIYCMRYMGQITYPLLYRNDKMIYLSNSHNLLSDSTVAIQFYDIKGKNIYTQKIIKDSSSYCVPVLENNSVYMCAMTIGGRRLTQPILCGNPEEMYAKYILLKKTIKENDPILNQIEALLYRMNFLIHHKSHDQDWWWQFKITQVCYELENVFSNYKDTGSKEINSWGIQFKTYISALDSSVQRYLLITPDSFIYKKDVPLVVIIRPYIDNHYHIFVSPQVARYWSLTHAKALANQFGFAFMMPEARLYRDEDLIPFAESEIICAIEDVKKQYPIDSTNIFLQGNCSGGYRALKMAAQHPDLFAAVGLYAPLYHCPYENEWSKQNCPEKELEHLVQIPVFIHYDIYDTHSPFSMFKDFIEDCKNKKMDLTVSQKRFSGKLYNVLLTGEETLAFFKDKKRVFDPDHFTEEHRTKITNHSKMDVDYKTNNIIADVYAQPFIFVYNSSDQSKQYKETVDSIRREYENYFFCKMPLVSTENVKARDLKEKNLFFIGHQFDNPGIVDLLSKLPFNVGDNQIQIKGKSYKGRNNVFQAVFSNPLNKKKLIVIYSTNSKGRFFHILQFPWKNSLSDCIVL